MELILYYIKESAGLLISFLILMFVLGIVSYLLIRNFKQTSKMKVGLYGLFIGLKNIDIVKLSIAVIRIFLIFYSIMITTKETIFVCLIMLGLLSLMYIILTPKKLVNELVITIIEIVMIYFINIINSYMSEIGFSSIIMAIKICLTVFIILLSTYFLLRNIADIVDSRWKKEFDRNRKDIKNEE